MRCYLPAIALFAWAICVIVTVVFDVDPVFVRIGGPLVTAIATGVHIRDEIHTHKKREERRHRAH